MEKTVGLEMFNIPLSLHCDDTHVCVISFHGCVCWGGGEGKGGTFANFLFSANELEFYQSGK